MKLIAYVFIGWPLKRGMGTFRTVAAIRPFLAPAIESDLSRLPGAVYIGRYYLFVFIGFQTYPRDTGPASVRDNAKAGWRESKSVGPS